MRIERLDVIRYGALTGKTFEFRSDARLHLVYGPNEAGKTSVLAAIGDLLFGFGHTRAYDFLHDATSLRVAARLTGANGSGVAFRRRRGNRNTLLSDDDNEAAQRDDLLAPFLGTLNRQTFERAFGLDSHRLRDGADELLRSGGDSGDALFAAGAGLTGLSRLRGKLDEDASGLFAPRASSQRKFYQTLDRYDLARRAEQEVELRGRDWKDLLDRIEAAEARRTELHQSRQRVGGAITRLERLRRLHPLSLRLAANREQLATFADLAAFEPSAAEALKSALDGQKAAAAALNELSDRIEREQQALDAIAGDPALLDAAESIAALVEQAGAVKKAQADLPVVAAEREEYDGQIVLLLQKLGLKPDVDLVVARPSDAALAELTSLVATGRALRERVTTASTRFAEENTALDKLKSEELGSLVDPGPWRDRFDAMEPDLDRLRRRDEKSLEQSAVLRRLTERAARLQPPIGDIGSLATASLPTVATVATHRKALADLDAELASRTQQFRMVDDEVRNLSELVAQDETGRPIPDNDAIVTARRDRDAQIARIKAVSLSGMGVSQQALVSLEASVMRADDLADAALGDAERVTRHATHSQQLRERQRLRADAEQELADVRARRDAAFAAYRDLFAAAGLEPGATDDMTGWLGSVADLLEERQKALALADELATLDALAVTIEPALLEVAEGIGVETGALPLGSLVRAIEARLGKLGELWVAGRSLADRRREGERRVSEAETELEAAKTARQGWSQDFTISCRELKLNSGATIEGIEAALKVWERLPEAQRERDSRVRRVSGMERDIAAFETALGELVRAAAPDLAGQAPFDAVAALGRRADKSRADAAVRADISRKLDELKREAAEREEAARVAEAALARLTADLPAGSDLAALLERLGRRDRIAEELAQLAASFAALADGAAETDFAADLAAFDPVAADRELEALAAEADELQDDIEENAGELAKARQERVAIEARGGAERAAFDKHAAEAELFDISRRWVVLKLASTLLSGAIEKHREANANPLLGRAGALLARLTNGSLVQLVEEYDESDNPILKGVRGSGERLAVGAMSEGTRDQLYLALRLAFLERYASNAEPAPFIGDDIFQTFDDERTIAGLRTLADVGASFQPILFTHHHAVADAAYKTLGSDLDLIEW